MLAVAETARRARNAPDLIHLWPTPDDGSPPSTDSTAAPRQCTDPELDHPATIAWFSSNDPMIVQDACGAVREAGVEAAILLGLARWSPGMPLASTTGWHLRARHEGLALYDPSGQVFAYAIVRLSAAWTATALSTGVVAAYGALTEEGLPAQGPFDAGRRLHQARRSGRVAAGLVRLLQ
ncbi:hypothetical protein D7223_32250 [Micromonospora endolithica]|uniref:Uncharacterized protein n=2 Tax=Micromonospora endolithica TaxID=230091 RepID=A0A3A9YNN9_9ACTN|nr:hypothetical protein D7223_32250 [Micromonospora endolithica]